MATLSLNNVSRPAPKWFRKTKRAIMILVVAANTMIGSWGLKDPLLVARLQMWCTIGMIALMEALEIFLANGEEYIETEENDSKRT
jgi:hypothetical protein